MQADPITNMATIVIGVGLFLFVLINAISIRGYTRSVPFSFAMQLIIMITSISALALYALITQVAANSIITITAGVAGLVLGFLLGGTQKLFKHRGHIVIKRSMIPGIFVMIAYIASALFNIFGKSNLMSLGIIFVTAATGFIVGSASADCISAIVQEGKIQNETQEDNNTELEEQPVQQKTKTRLPI